jgi:hypothetical protein
MRNLAIASVLGAACLMGPSGARADVTISVNKETQNMLVLVDGVEKYNWKVSTGTGGAPRSGTYKPQRLEKKWFSHKYHMSPMPSSIFFHEGFAIHGTQYVSNLGHRASHGCVRLHPQNAATLFDLVKGEGMGGTTIVISNDSHIAARPAALPKVEAQVLSVQALPPRETSAKAPVVETAEAPARAELAKPAAAAPPADDEIDPVTRMSNE